MSTIAIIDDNFEQGQTILHNIEIEIKLSGSDLSVIHIYPFRNEQDYFLFIEQNEVSVLILDEKLNDKTIDDNGPVSYKGSDLISFLRQALKNLPIYSITSFNVVEELKDKESQFEQIIKRSDFIENSHTYFSRIQRSANNFLIGKIDELNEFNDLTTKISSGCDEPELNKKLNALQIKLELPFSGYENRNAWLKEYEKQIDLLESLKELLKNNSK